MNGIQWSFFPDRFSAQDTSIPAAVFVWHVQNNRSDDVEVAITMTMENGVSELMFCYFFSVM